MMVANWFVGGVPEVVRATASVEFVCFVCFVVEATPLTGSIPGLLTGS